MIRTIALISVFSMLSLCGRSQSGSWPYITFFDFEDPSNVEHLWIDTVSNPNNLWQVGQPQKTIFTSAFGGNNVIVTDTINSYTVNDTSSFIIYHTVQSGLLGTGDEATIQGVYWSDSDSLNDFWKIEFSPDNGATWVLISDDTTTFGSSQSWPIIENCNMTGGSNGWTYFSINLWYATDYF